MRTDMIRHDVETTYEKVKSLAGWSVDKNVVLTIASYYLTAEREFDAAAFNRAMETLKSRTGWFSPIRGQLMPVIAAFLAHSDRKIDEEVDRLFEKQKVLRGEGFRNTIHSFLAAFLMTDNPSEYTDEARKAKMLFDAMKKQHYFLTSDDDYAYAVLLSKNGENPERHAANMRKYYNAFREKRYRSGNELQWLSQIMTYIDVEYNEQYVERADEIFKQLKRETKATQVHYPMVGFLAIFQVDNEKIDDIVQLTKQLEHSKPFKWNREMALSVAIGYVLYHLTDDSTAQVSVSLATSVEMILQAQQAVMAATMAAFVASSTTSSTNN